VAWSKIRLTHWNTSEEWLRSPSLLQVSQTKYWDLHFIAMKGRWCNSYGTRLKLGTCGVINKFVTDALYLLRDCIHKKAEMPSPKIWPLTTATQLPPIDEGA